MQIALREAVSRYSNRNTQRPANSVTQLSDKCDKGKDNPVL
eukprot:gene26942-32442_t